MSLSFRVTLADIVLAAAAAHEAQRALAAASLDTADFLEVPAQAAFDVTPEAATAFFRAKGLRATFSHADMIGEAHDHAFTVAKMMDMDLLAQVRTSLDEALATGTPFGEWKQQIEPLLKKAGWWGEQPVRDPATGATAPAQLGSAWRLETVFRTNMQQAYAVEAWRSIVEGAELAPFLMYDAVDDLRTRAEHRAWDGTVLRWDHPWFKSHFPPCGFNSVVPDQRVRGNTLLALQARYSGEVVEVVGESGGRFTVTAQHPVLTTRGWVDAQALRQGDELVAYRHDACGGAVPADLNEDDAPPKIKQVFDALALRAGASVPRAAMHLNGDALFFESDVEVVGADRELVRRVQAAALEFVAKVDLLNTDHGERLRATLRALMALFNGDGAAASGTGCGDARDASGAVLCELGAHRIRFDPVRAEVSCDVLAALAQALRDVPHAQALLVEADDLMRDWFADLRALAPTQPIAEKASSFRAGALDPGIADDPVGGFGVNANAARDIMDRHSGAVQVDRVAALCFSHYDGHVYDLQTVSGTMVLDGGLCLPQYVVSNCRCGVVQLSPDDLQAMGLSVSPEAPDDGTYRWRNPRTGMPMTVPKGVDPGFDRNPGAAYVAQLERLAREKISQIADPVTRKAAETGMASVARKTVLGRAAALLADLADDVQRAGRLAKFMAAGVVDYVAALFRGAAPSAEQRAAFEALSQTDRRDIERRVEAERGAD